MIILVYGVFSDHSQWLTIFPADPRFSNIQTDPRFRLPSRKTTHVQIGKRFAPMLHNEEFSSQADVDRFGRKLPKDAGKKELRKYYRIEEDGNDGEDGVNEEVDNDGEVEMGLQCAYARDVDILTSSSEESSSEEDDSADATEDEIFGFPDEQGGDVQMGEPSSRLAVVNMDWDNIRAVDLMAVFSSFTPGNGRMLKISIYPSEFGKERMEREEMEGPPKEIFALRKAEMQDDPVISNLDSDEEGIDDVEDDEKVKNSLIKEDQGHKFNSAKLRRYQLERLRYYYAVITCSSTPVAEAIYEAVDGTEYLTTANFFDLRFIPKEVDFSDDKPRDECDKVPDGYRPNEFVTDALQHSKVRLTWDADDGTRKEAQKRAFAGSRADIDENDLKAYLGSDSSEDEVEPVNVDTTTETKGNGVVYKDADKHIPKLSRKEAERQRKRALLGLPTETKNSKKRASSPVGDMQITFSSAFTEEPKRETLVENEPPLEETTVGKYIRKEKERKSKRKEKMKNNSIANPTIDQAQGEEVPSTDVDNAEDLGFDDPFFTKPASKAPSKTKSQKAQKAPQDSTSLAQLELLMLPERGATKDSIKHFDIEEIALAERALLKSKKRKGNSRLSNRQKSALEAMKEGGDDFEINVQDPRFGAVYDRTEFAIDPSHPKFKGTEGMKMLLEEGRKKRRREDIEDGDGKWCGNLGKNEARNGNEVDQLVANVRRKVMKT